jgi:hypothetical protein
LVSFVCFQLKADNATVAFIYLAVIVLLSLMGSYFDAPSRRKGSCGSPSTRFLR